MKKKGFTLVELLAVIVILAVVSIIAIPIIINIIETTRKGALKDSVHGLMKAADMYYFENMKNAEEGVQIEIVDSKQTAPQSPKLNYKGDVKTGYVLIAYDGKVAVCVDDTKYFASKTLDEDEIITDLGTCTSEFDEDLQAFVTAGSMNYTGLKLNVKAFKSKDLLPSKSTAGTVALITEDKVTGYYATDLAPSEPKEGNVWVMLNSHSDKFVTTKNTRVGVSYALQYKNGEWVLKDTYIYENDKWEQLKYFKESDYVWDYDYDGKYKTFTAPFDGYYTIELWGASGGDYNASITGGRGAYTKGDIYLDEGEELYIYVGNKPESNGEGWNGGGSAYGAGGRGGGGATDVRTVATSSETVWNERDSLLSRIMVAAGGGGATYHGGNWYSSGGDAGGLEAYLGTGGSSATSYAGTRATQIKAGIPYYADPGQPGGFGYGGYGAQNENNGGGGSGWYGGGGCSEAGGLNSGGSSYISGHEGSVAVDTNMTPTASNISNTGKYFLNTIMIDGKGYKWTHKIGDYVGIPTYANESVKTVGNLEVGHARITFRNFDAITEEEYIKIQENIQNIWEFQYMGYYQKFVVPRKGTYKIELWGAAGGTYDSSRFGGKGAYTSGEIKLNKNDVLYVYVGQMGQVATNAVWNGGGSAYGSGGRGGGGATDIRTVPTSSITTWNQSDSLRSRIMVAAGGGGATYHGANWYSSGGDAGGLEAYLGTGGSSATSYAGTIATQIKGGTPYYADPGQPGGFGYGGYGAQNENNGGGGSGWFGGGGCSEAGGLNSGGTSYISGHNGCIGINDDGTLNTTTASKVEDSYSYTGFVFTNTQMIDGKGYSWTNQVSSSVVKMNDPITGVKKIGNDGDGYARITFVK